MKTKWIASGLVVVVAAMWWSLRTPVAVDGAAEAPDVERAPAVAKDEGKRLEAARESAPNLPAATAQGAAEPEPRARKFSVDPPFSADERRQLADEETAYKWLFENTDLAGLKLEQETVELDYMQLTTQEFNERFDSGLYEHLKREDGRVGAAPADDFVMEAMRQLPDGSYYRVVLPRAEFPEAFDMKKRIQWLDDIVRAREAQLASGATGK